jgi:hypothetical protein
MKMNLIFSDIAGLRYPKAGEGYSFTFSKVFLSLMGKISERSAARQRSPLEAGGLLGWKVLYHERKSSWWNIKQSNRLQFIKLMLQ